MKITRQTYLSLEELSTELEKPRPSQPRCLIINEIGEICKSGNKKAEKFLQRSLDSENREDRLCAFCWLSVTTNIDQQTSLKMEEFKKNLDNKEILVEAEKLLKNHRRQHIQTIEKGYTS